MKRLQRLNNFKRNQTHPNLRPRDAASLVIVDLETPSYPRVLMGRRHPKQDFMPDKFVFPGGGVIPSDSRLCVPDDLNPADCNRLLKDMKGRSSPARARGLALCAIRETFEETGFLVGRRCAHPQKTRSPVWCKYFAAGITPDLSSLTFIARAITPPRRTRRYDTRFFLASREQIVTNIGDGDGEFVETHWIAIEDSDQYDLHPMTRTILDDVAALIDPGSGIIRTAPVPYYFMRNGIFRRQLIEA